MRRIILLIAVSAIFTCYLQAQENCTNNAVGVHYVAPKGVSVEIIKSGQFQIGIGAMYTSLTTSEKNAHNLSYSLDMLVFGGVRVYHVDYRTAVYTNVGMMMGDIFGPRLYLSGKLMLLRNQKAWNIEPFYCRKPGIRLGIYKLI